MSRLTNLPRDILFHILRDVVLSQQSNIVFPECRQKDSPHQMKLYYPHSGVTKRYGRKFRARSHWELVRVWLALNTTCRFMRRIGTEAWYEIVQFAMYSSLPQRLQAHQGEPTQLSLRLHLARIKNLVLVDHYAGSPSKLLALPRCLNFFSRLRSCTLVYKYVISRLRNGEKPDLPFHRVYRTLEKAVTNPLADDERDQNEFSVIQELRALLHAIGVPGDIHIDIAIPAKVDRDTICRSTTMGELRDLNVPMLRIRADALQRQAKSKPAKSNKGFPYGRKSWMREMRVRYAGC